MNPFLMAAESHFKSNLDAAALKMNIYSSNAVGIGDHANFLEEFISSVKQYNDARECIRLVQEMSSKKTPEKETDED